MTYTIISKEPFLGEEKECKMTPVETCPGRAARIRLVYRWTDGLLTIADVCTTCAEKI